MEPDEKDLAGIAKRVLEKAWTSYGYTSPNSQTYPWLWLWDSCFHSVIWSHLGDARAIAELEAVFSSQTTSGFVPHMSYQADPDSAVAYWGLFGSSSITQPPMFGHALRVASEAGFDIPPALLIASQRALEHLVNTRKGESGLLRLVHPWETGCDDSIRWSVWMPQPFEQSAWRETKTTLLGSVSRDADGMGTANSQFDPTSVAFTALTAFNLNEVLALVDDPVLQVVSKSLGDALDAAWDPDLSTWSDGTHVDGNSQTLEALLPLLVSGRADAVDRAFETIMDPSAFRAPFGLRQTSVQDARYDPSAYWRGPVWPQLCYLVWVAARQRGRGDVMEWIAESTERGARESRFAEYWNPETGEGLGAIPQSWTGLAAVMSAST